jgi:hypothetical protein
MRNRVYSLLLENRNIRLRRFFDRTRIRKDHEGTSLITLVADSAVSLSFNKKK